MTEVVAEVLKEEEICVFPADKVQKKVVFLVGSPVENIKLENSFASFLVEDHQESVDKVTNRHSEVESQKEPEEQKNL